MSLGSSMMLILQVLNCNNSHFRVNHEANYTAYNGIYELWVLMNLLLFTADIGIDKVTIYC